MRDSRSTREKHKGKRKAPRIRDWRDRLSTEDVTQMLLGNKPWDTEALRHFDRQVRSGNLNIDPSLRGSGYPRR